MLDPILAPTGETASSECLLRFSLTQIPPPIATSAILLTRIITFPSFCDLSAHPLHPHCAVPFIIRSKLTHAMTSTDTDEPDRKKIRFEKPPNDSNSPQSPTQQKKHVLQASEVVELRFLSEAPTEQISASASHPTHLTAHPTYLHQVIPNAQILGWTELLVAVYIHIPSLSVWIDQSGTPADVEQQTDVPALLSQFVKNGLCATKSQFISAATSFTALPLSNLVNKFTRGDHTYAIYKEKFFTTEDNTLTKRTAFHNLHLRMAFLMFLHIDGANFIDHDDPRWEVFVAARLKDDKPVSLVGYATIYPFSALASGQGQPVTFSERIRISQVFILPSCQSEGHGSRLLSAIYDDASARKAMEVTVEDPNRGFRVLRDITDLKRCYTASLLDKGYDFARDREEHLLDSLRKALFMTKGQARRCLEVHRLRFIDRSDEAVYKKYRLWVKRRLYAENVEVLHQYEGQLRKDKLAEIYTDYEGEYTDAISRLEGSLRRAEKDQVPEAQELPMKVSEQVDNLETQHPQSENKVPDQEQSKPPPQVEVSQ